MKNRYIVNISIRVILLSITCFILVWLFMNTERPATLLFVFLILIVQTLSFIIYHNRVIRDLSNFLVFLEEDNTTLSFSKKRVERNFQGIVAQLDRINLKIQAARLERERQYNYLQALVKQIDTGIISFDQTGNIGIFNHAASELLGLRKLKNVSELIEHFPELAAEKLAGRKNSNTAVRVIVDGRDKMLSVKMGAIKIRGYWIHIISLQNIKPELEAGELDAWRRLIRIQRHEIINSLTPITTLTAAIKRRFLKGDSILTPIEIVSDLITDTLESIEVIEERSKGLIAFMERYKTITDLPGLKYGIFNVNSLFNNIYRLFEKDIIARGIKIETLVVPEGLTMHGDEKLLEQVLINLVKNSIEAIRNSGEIKISAFKNAGSLCIQVTDNGSGIESKAMESIFVPSYTTKENGSGIGLSISRQIIQLHKGTIEVKSEPGKETTFDITLPDYKFNHLAVQTGQ